jgi:mannose/fructose/N-acetylgalactosamine-specific phosphotransferase system component IID
MTGGEAMAALQIRPVQFAIASYLAMTGGEAMAALQIRPVQFSIASCLAMTGGEAMAAIQMSLYSSRLLRASQ